MPAAATVGFPLGLPGDGLELLWQLARRSVTRLVEAPKRKELPPALARIGYAVQRAIGAIGTEVIVAHDEADLVARLDMVLENGMVREYTKRIGQAVETALGRNPRLLDGLAEGPGLSRDLPDSEAARDMEEAERVITESWRACRSLWQSNPRVKKVASQTAESAAQHPPLGFLSEAPVPIARLLLAHSRGVAAMFALMLLVANHETGKTWLVRSLARRFLDGERAILRLLASSEPFIPGLSISTKLVPKSERLDLRAIAAEQESVESWIALRAKEAAESGTDRG